MWSPVILGDTWPEMIYYRLICPLPGSTNSCGALGRKPKKHVGVWVIKALSKLQDTRQKSFLNQLPVSESWFYKAFVDLIVTNLKPTNSFCFLSIQSTECQEALSLSGSHILNTSLTNCWVLMDSGNSHCLQCISDMRHPRSKGWLQTHDYSGGPG